MNVESRLSNQARPVDPQLKEIIKLAIFAVGGQGGGVLTQWIVNLAERNGYAVQATSVAGVAQRTGATIYYVEMLAKAERQPVFSLMPSPGDVDVVIAAELMEAGRAIMRGFVSPGRTTLIASSHRAYATMEKIAPGEAIADSGAVHETALAAANRFISFDMNEIAVSTGSVISASLFGALAGSGALPFSSDQFEDTLNHSSRANQANLIAFRSARAIAAGDAPEPKATSSTPKQPAATAPVSTELNRRWEELVARVHALPVPAQDMAMRGLEKVVDFQDPEYGSEYLDQVERVSGIDAAAGGAERDFALTTTAAKYTANAMTYDDIIRVADLKTRQSRYERIADEAGTDDNTQLRITEYFHPGSAEACSMLPAGLGRAVEARPRILRMIDGLINRGWHVRSDTITGFAMLYILAGLRRRRRKLLRHEVERRHLNAWLEAALSRAESNYDLAIETVKCQRLIKGYSDTHARGLSKFDRVMSGMKLVEDRADAGDWAARLISSALADEQGNALDGALQTIRTFSTEARG